MKKLIAFALGFFMACSAYASFPATEQTEQFRLGSGLAWDWTREDAAATYMAYKEAADVSGAYNYRIDSITTTGGAGYGILFYGTQYNGVWNPGSTEAWYARQAASGYSCPANSTLDGTTCTCSAGYDQSGSTCVPHVNQCSTRPPGITNFTVGYVRSLLPDDYDVVGTANQLPSNMQVCDAGCTVTFGAATAAWRSETPTSQGLHRISLDFQSTPTGAECATPSTPVSKTEPPPNCPGYVGEVNGKTGCYGTASNPVTTTKGISQGLNTKPGNPAAGEKPATGEGSGSTGAGRTPTTGNGTNSGGPAGAAGNAGGYGGGSGTRDVEEGKEQLECGAPGQPKCAIDETGTQSGKGTSFVGGETQLDANKASLEQAISGAQGIAAPSWSFSFALPTGCTPFAVEMPFVNFTMNPCLAQGMIHDLMSMIWAAVTAFTIISMVGKTIRES